MFSGKRAIIFFARSSSLKSRLSAGGVYEDDECVSRQFTLNSYEKLIDIKGCFSYNPNIIRNLGNIRKINTNKKDGGK